MKLRQWLITLLLLASAGMATANELTVLTYHDVVADPGGDFYAISRPAFVAQMDYLQTNGYQPVSLAFLHKVINNEEKLPDKAILLTFDDALKSYQDFVVPLLGIYGYPSVLSVVSGWVDGNNQPDEYKGKLMSWPELRNLSKNPRIEIISHSHELHTNVQSNPQGNYAPAGVTRIYSPITGGYETEIKFRQRIFADLKLAVARLKEELNITPVGITWPYGSYDNVTAGEANLLGLRFQLTLDDGPNSVENIPVLNRIMVMRDTEIDDFISDLNYEPLQSQTHRFTEISLDKFSGQPQEHQEKLLSSLLDNIQQSDVNTVILSPFSSDGKRAFFPNQEMSVAADILNRVTHQLRSRANIRHIYLRIPESIDRDKSDEFFTDLARLNWFNGVVFEGQEPERVEKIRKIMSYFHPKTKFGHYGENNELAQFDFVLMSVTASQSIEQMRKKLQEAKALPTRLFINVKVSKSETAAIPQIVQTIRTLGINDYGIALDKDFYTFDNKFILKNTTVKGMLAGIGG
ncbi:MAG TPA: polysaccharide deacetylase family protein [Gammaproteobacteria bacterium]